MANRLQVHEGQRFGKLVVVREIPFVRVGNEKFKRFIECKCDCGNVKNISIYHLLKGMVKSCGEGRCVVRENLDVVGKKYNRLTILKEIESKTYTRKSGSKKNVRMVEVQCDCGTIKTMQLNAVVNGRNVSCGCFNREQSHKNKSLIFGVGVNDYDGNVLINGKTIQSYTIWQGMIERCYSEKALIKAPTYRGCTVCDEWKHFTNFKKWFDENYVDGYCLDKDIIVAGNRIYSPITCCFVPNRINTTIAVKRRNKGEYPTGVHYNTDKKKFIASYSYVENGKRKVREIGRFNNPKDAQWAYKYAKELYVKNLATEYYNNGEINKKVYDALLYWEVPIED